MEISKHKHFSELPVLAMLVGQVITRLPSIQKLTKLFFQGIFSCFGKWISVLHLLVSLNRSGVKRDLCYTIFWISHIDEWMWMQVIKHPSLTPSSSKRSGLFTMFLGEPAESQWKNTESLNVAGSLGPLASMHAVGPCFSACESMIEGPDGPELCISFTFATPVYTRDQMHSFATSTLELLSSEYSKSWRRNLCLSAQNQKNNGIGTLPKTPVWSLRLRELSTAKWFRVPVWSELSIMVPLGHVHVNSSNWPIWPILCLVSASVIVADQELI